MMHRTGLLLEMPLSDMPEGRECKVSSVNAGRGLARRLAELGFTFGARVLVKRSERGAMIVDLNGQRFALGRGIANKIGITCI